MEDEELEQAPPSIESRRSKEKERAVVTPARLPDVLVGRHALGPILCCTRAPATELAVARKLDRAEPSKLFCSLR
jgi:hypothetical protein